VAVRQWWSSRLQQSLGLHCTSHMAAQAKINCATYTSSAVRTVLPLLSASNLRPSRAEAVGAVKRYSSSSSHALTFLDTVHAVSCSALSTSSSHAWTLSTFNDP
jgi:hypothetical protein